MALQHADYTKLLKSSEAATTALTDADLAGCPSTRKIAQQDSSSTFSGHPSALDPERKLQ